jgi:hypothetical protein
MSQAVSRYLRGLGMSGQKARLAIKRTSSFPDDEPFEFLAFKD